MKKIILVLNLFLLQNSYSLDQFLPENDLYIPVGVKREGGLSEKQFHAVLDKVESIYSPILLSMGKKLIMERKWADGVVQATAYAPKSLLTFYGGLARHPIMSEDGFTLVACHEVGHLIGGLPKLSQGGSVEGQADYFATLKCLRQVFMRENNSEILNATTIPQILIEACNKSFSKKIDRDICLRSGLSAITVGNFFASLSKVYVPVDISTPDPKQVASTNMSYPGNQCRLDTFFQGALCEKSLDEDVSQTDEFTGICKTGVGSRPNCWFRSSDQ